MSTMRLLYYRCVRGQIIEPQKGISLLETIVAIFLFSIIGLAVAQSAIISVNFQKRAEIGSLAKNLAVSKAEQLSGVRLDLLDSTYGGTESNLSVSGHIIKFSRVTAVTVNSDGSRTVTVTVSSTSPLLPTPIVYTTRFAPWEA